MVSAPLRGRWVSANDWSALAGEVAVPAPAVSVIVVHYEQPGPLARTLEALGRQRYDGPLEVIVVDDGSRVPPDVPPGVQRVIQRRAGARRSAARNAGVAASHGEVLCFLDADTAPEPGYVAALTRLPALVPEAVTVGRRRHARFDGVPAGADVATAGPLHELPSPRWLSEGYVATHDLREPGPRGFRFIISAVLACTRWCFDEVGGFDEDFDAYGGEDWEWAHRAWCRGMVFAHVPDAVAWHDGPAWEGRGADAAGLAAGRAEKNAEAMRLAQRITVAGHRPRGLLSARAETVVEIDADLGPAGAFVCVDSLLAALASVAVRVPAALAPTFAGDPRVVVAGNGQSPRVACPALHITVHAGLTVRGGGLAELCRGMLEADDGLYRLSDGDGELMSITSSRHRARVARWGERAGLAVRAARPDWLIRHADPPDVEAYLGGWER